VTSRVCVNHMVSKKGFELNVNLPGSGLALY